MQKKLSAESNATISSATIFSRSGHRRNSSIQGLEPTVAYFVERSRYAAKLNPSSNQRLFPYVLASQHVGEYLNEKAQQKRFDSLYRKHINALKRQGKAEATIDAYSRAIRCVSEYFDCPPNVLTEEQLEVLSPSFLIFNPTFKGVFQCEYCS